VPKGGPSECGGESQALPLGPEARDDSLHLLLCSMKTRVIFFSFVKNMEE